MAILTVLFASFSTDFVNKIYYLGFYGIIDKIWLNCFIVMTLVVRILDLSVSLTVSRPIG